MTFTPSEIWQYVAWFLGLIEIVVALYILVLNVWHTANRHVGGWLLLTAASTIASGFLFTADSTEEILTIFVIQVMVTPASQVGWLIVTSVLLAPETRPSRYRWAWAPIYVIAFLPMLLTLLDLRLGSNLWFTPTVAEGVTGIMLTTTDFERGMFAAPLRIVNMVLPMVGLFLALYVALRKSTPSLTRRLAWLLFAGLLFGVIVQFGLSTILTISISSVLSSAMVAGVFAYIGFRQMVSERRLQRGRLQIRLASLMLVIAVPLIVAIAFFLNNLAARALSDLTTAQLNLTAAGLKANIETWLALNEQSVQELALLPDIVSMDPARQKPVLLAKAQASPQFYLVHTTDLTGMNVARNDGEFLKDYSDRLWFQGARAGQVTTEVLLGRTIGRPAMSIAAPIRDESGIIVGVVSAVSRLDAISAQVSVSKVGKTGVSYVVDRANWVVAHPDPDFLMKDNALVDMSQSAPVVHLRTKGPGLVLFTDAQGVRWDAHVEMLDNGWGIVVQQQESELQSLRRTLGVVSFVIISVGASLLMGLVLLAIRQAIQPINSLMQTAAAVAAGDFNRVTPVESEDEFGAMARSFNDTTSQLRELIGGLEQRVIERTADLKRRSDYLSASAEVARVAASILESERLVRDVVEVIRERFALYYVGLFLVDESNQWAVLKAGTGQAGRAMLAREHKLPITGSSMIGWSIMNAQARIALQAEADAVRRVTAELPETRSEAALPLRARSRVVGALTVQSAQLNAFDEDTITVFQTMADQIAIALENARLLAESQAAVEAIRRASGEASRQGWQQLLQSQAVAGVHGFEGGVTVGTEGPQGWPDAAQRAAEAGQTVYAAAPGNAAPLAVPVYVRGNVIGVIDTFKPAGNTWTAEEIALAETLAEQLGIALESARLYQDTQRRAAQERLIGLITAKMRESLDMERVLNTTADEIYQTLGLDRLVIQLAAEDTPSH
ncbi:MAG TPA: cache domain-containing protein [Anaerolineae bacterium]|nr:cache domain-containing protein [Anaerolineae bacterium]